MNWRSSSERFIWHPISDHSCYIGIVPVFQHQIFHPGSKRALYIGCNFGNFSASRFLYKFVFRADFDVDSCQITDSPTDWVEEKDGARL
jgi:hypothetical protein